MRDTRPIEEWKPRFKKGEVLRPGGMVMLVVEDVHEFEPSMAGPNISYKLEDDDDWYYEEALLELF
jgi:hypothetical protein